MPHKPYAEQIAAQITEQIGQHLYIAQIALRNQQEELDSVEKDLRVILNVRKSITSMTLKLINSIVGCTNWSNSFSR